MPNTMLIDYNLEKKCRMCLQSAPDMDSFFNIYFEDLSLAKVFKNITSYEVSFWLLLHVKYDNNLYLNCISN